MAERSILFSAPMVQALLAGRKTQTRRIVKPQPSAYVAPPSVHPDKHPAPYFDAYNGGPHWCWWTPDDRQGPDWIRCPYGKPGDMLWVRETWSHTGEGVWTIADARKRLCGHPIYAATHEGPKPLGWWPSIHMPREFSRITLEVTDVRMERLGQFSADDARAEGLEWASPTWGIAGIAPSWRADPVEAYASLWEHINGEGSWEANPWVWAVSFKVLDQATLPDRSARKAVA